MHDYYDFLQSCNGTGSYPGTDCQMNGFDDEYWGCGHSCPNSNPPYSYVPHSETKPYFYMGKHYVLADQMYASNVDASSFISHQYIVAGQASSAVNYPSSSWGCEGGSGDQIATLNQDRQYGSDIQMCFNNNTLGAEMDTAGLSWAYYASTINGDGGIWSAYQNIAPIYNGPDWSKDVISPQTNFFSDVSNGNLRSLSWVTPTCANSDHAGCGAKTGPAWVASLVNAIGESQYWNNTAIFIFWDDYGGWYDPEPPAMLDYDGLGHAHSDAGRFGVREEGSRLTYTLRARQHLEVRRGDVRTAGAGGERYTRDGPRRRLRFQQAAENVSRRFPLSSALTTSCIRRRTIVLRTTTKENDDA